MAILLPKRDNNAVNVLGLSILISMIVSFLIFLTFIILAFFNKNIFDSTGIGNIILLIPYQHF